MAALYALLCLIWGSTWLVIKIGLVGVPPFLGAGLRFLLACSILGALWLARGRRGPLTADDKKAILSCGLLSFTASYAAVYWAEQHISSGLTAVLHCLMPLVVAVLSRFWTKAETLGAGKLAGIFIAIAGTVLLFRPAAASSPRELAGMAVALGAVCLASVNLVLLKKYSRGTDIYALNACGMAIGAAAQLSVSFLLEDWGAVRWTASNAGAVIYLSLVGSVVAFLVYTHLIKTVAATRLSMISLIIPVVAVILGRVFLNERLGAMEAAGMTVILAGVGTALLKPD